MKSKNILAKLFIFVLLLSIVVSSVTVSAKETVVAPITENGTSFVAENNNLKLTVSEDGSLEILNKANGNIQSSRSAFAKTDKYSSNSERMKMMSEIVINYYNKKDALLADVSNESTSSDAQVTVSKKENSIIATYNFETFSIKFDVAYALKEDYFSASLITASIEEKGEYALNSVSILPALFSGTGEDDGYIIVPDGSGALINFNNGCNTRYTSSVYGADVSFDINMKRNYDREINMPVFGMVKNNHGMVAVIEEGDAVADITAASKNSKDFYNYVYTTAVIRKSYEKSMFTGNDKSKSLARKQLMQLSKKQNFTVRYYFLGENTDYVDLATKYREYLIEEKGLEKKVSSPTLNLELIGAVDVKANFLGFTYYDIKPLTTYNDAEVILAELKELGIEGINLKYSGWTKDGLTNKKILTKAKLESELGKKKDFNSLNTYADKNGVSIDWDVEVLKFYKGGNKYKVSSPFNETISFSRYMRSVYAKDITKRSWNLLSSNYIEKNANSVFASLDKLGIKNASVTTLSNSLYSNFNNKKTLTRTDMMNSVVKALSNNKKLKLSGEAAGAYAIPYISKIYATPTYSSAYKIFDEDIPFYQIVLHGFVDMTGESQFTSNNRKINYLRAVESGIQLFYRGIAGNTSQIVDTDYDYLYGTQFDLWKADAAAKYKEYQPLLARIYDSAITGHRKLQDNVYETEYANGVKVIVNYNEYKVTAAGVEVEGYGFNEVK